MHSVYYYFYVLCVFRLSSIVIILVIASITLELGCYHLTNAADLSFLSALFISVQLMKLLLLLLLLL